MRWQQANFRQFIVSARQRQGARHETRRTAHRHPGRQLGIGLATAQAAAREGASVVIASSRKARVDEAIVGCLRAPKATRSTSPTSGR